MAGSGDKMGSKGAAAVPALLSEPTHEKAAAKAGVSETTLRRWMKRPKFIASLRRARQRLIEQTVNQLVSICTEAVQTLQRNLSCGLASVEVRAAQTVLDQCTRVMELRELGERLEALEERLAAGDPK